MHDKLRMALVDIAKKLISMDCVKKKDRDEFDSVLKNRKLIKYIKIKLDRYHWVEVRAAFGIMVLVDDTDKRLDKLAWIHLARSRTILGSEFIENTLKRNGCSLDYISFSRAVGRKGRRRVV